MQLSTISFVKNLNYCRIKHVNKKHCMYVYRVRVRINLQIRLRCRKSVQHTVLVSIILQQRHFLCNWISYNNGEITVHNRLQIQLAGVVESTEYTNAQKMIVFCIQHVPQVGTVQRRERCTFLIFKTFSVATLRLTEKVPLWRETLLYQLAIRYNA